MTTFVEITAQPKKPLILFEAVPFEIGAFDNDKLLYNITDDPQLSIVIVEGKANIRYFLGILYITPLQEGNIVFKISYLGIFYFYAIYVTAPILVPSKNQLIDVLYNTLPPKCYTASKNSSNIADLSGTSAVYNDLYNDLRTIFLDYFPPFTSNRNWQTALNNYYPWQNSYDFGLVVQLFKNISTQRGNVYDTSLIISEYIYARLGLDLFVYIEEEQYILSDQWILDVSELDVTTILGDGSAVPNEIIIYIKIAALPTEFLNELNLFVNKILASGIYYQIITTNDFDQFGLIINVGDVYDLDPRLYVPYALKYTTRAVYNAVALCSPFNPFFLVNFDYAPPGGTIDIVVGTVELIATATYLFEGNYYYQDVTDNTIFESNNPTVLSMFENIATLNNAGIANVTATWENNEVSHEFIIGPTVTWIMDFDELDVTTILYG